jgi:hypothetical protein
MVRRVCPLGPHSPGGASALASLASSTSCPSSALATPSDGGEPIEVQDHSRFVSRMAEGDYEAVRTPLVMSCLILDRPKAMSQNAHMTLLSLKIRLTPAAPPGRPSQDRPYAD